MPKTTLEKLEEHQRFAHMWCGDLQPRESRAPTTAELVEHLISNVRRELVFLHGIDENIDGLNSSSRTIWHAFSPSFSYQGASRREIRSVISYASTPAPWTVIGHSLGAAIQFLAFTRTFDSAIARALATETPTMGPQGGTHNLLGSERTSRVSLLPRGMSVYRWATAIIRSSPSLLAEVTRLLSFIARKILPTPTPPRERPSHHYRRREKLTRASAAEDHLAPWPASSTFVAA